MASFNSFVFIRFHGSGPKALPLLETCEFYGREKKEGSAFFLITLLSDEGDKQPQTL